MKKAESNINRRGQSLLEILVALGVFAIVMSAVFLLVFGGRSLNRDSSDAQGATEYATEALEAIRSLRDRAWENLTDGIYGVELNGGQWELVSATNTKGIWERTVEISSIDANTKLIEALVLWDTDPLRTQSIVLVEQLTNWANALTPSLCGLSGDWSQPQLLGSTDLGAGREGTDLAVRNAALYASSRASSQSKNDFSIYDITNPSSPQLVSELNTGYGINEFFVNGNYVYAVSDDNDKEFIVLDVSSTSTPQEVGSLNLSGSGDANSVTYANGYAIVGRDYSSSNAEIEIIDVSNPAGPVVAAQLNLSTTIMRVYVSGNLLYYAYYNITDDVGIRDISNPPSTTFLGAWNIGADDVQSLFKEDDTHFHLGGAWGSGFYFGQGDDPENFEQYTFKNVGGYVNDVLVSDNLAFLGTTNANKEFQIINVSSDQTIQEIASMNLAQVGTGLTCKENVVFMSIRSNDAIQILTSTPE